MNKEEISYILESLNFKKSIYRDKEKRNLSFNDDEYYSNILIEYIEELQQENKELHNKIDKAIEYLVNPVEKIWEGHSIDEVVRILKDSDVDD